MVLREYPEVFNLALLTAQTSALIFGNANLWVEFVAGYTVCR